MAIISYVNSFLSRRFIFIVCVSLFLTNSYCVEQLQPTLNDKSWLAAFAAAHLDKVRAVEEWSELRKNNEYQQMLKTGEETLDALNKSADGFLFIQFETMQVGSVGSAHYVGFIANERDSITLQIVHPYPSQKPTTLKVAKNLRMGKDIVHIFDRLVGRKGHGNSFRFTSIAGVGGHGYARLFISDGTKRASVVIGGPVESAEGRELSPMFQLLQKVANEASKL